MLGIAIPIEKKPIVIIGMNTNLGVVDGDAPSDITFRVFNPHLSPAKFDLHAPSCTADGRTKQTITVAPLTSKLVDYPFDPSNLKVGGRTTISHIARLGWWS